MPSSLADFNLKTAQPDADALVRFTDGLTLGLGIHRLASRIVLISATGRSSRLSMSCFSAALNQPDGFAAWKSVINTIATQATVPASARMMTDQDCHQYLQHRQYIRGDGLVPCDWRP